jgi:hypothetical protein
MSKKVARHCSAGSTSRMLFLLDNHGPLAKLIYDQQPGAAPTAAQGAQRVQ